MFAIFETYLDDGKEKIFDNKVFHYLPIVSWAKQGENFKPVVLIRHNGAAAYQVGEDNRLIGFDAVDVGTFIDVYSRDELDDMLGSESVISMNYPTVPFFMIEYRKI